VRIAFDYQTFFWQSYGGISRYVVRLAEHLAALKQDVGIFAPLHRSQYLKELPAGLVHGYGLKSYPPRSGKVIQVVNQQCSIQMIKRWNPQVVHETYYAQKGSAPASCPTVVTVYDMIHERFRDNFSRHDKSSQLKKIAIERADHVICISENTRRDLLELFGINEKKVSVVYLGFDKFPDNKHTTDTPLVATRPYLLYVGNRGEYKNFSGFVKAIASSKKLIMDFDIVAYGGGKFTSSELALLSESAIPPDHVIQISGNDTLLGHLYREASAFVYPSRYEGFGLPPLEAMAHDCPVISSNTSSMPEVIGEAGEYFDPNSIDNMAAAMERVLYSSTRRDALVQSGHHRLNHFSWRQCAKETLEIYRTLGDGA
jgi:glycosyltransferase involved in cell wall biosynthesis